MSSEFDCSFFMFPGVGLVISELGSCPSHPEMLKGMGVSDSDAERIINDIPRGYYKDGNIAIYQERNIDTPGYVLAVKAEHYDFVKKCLCDLKKILNLLPDTPVFFDMIVGEIGDVWDFARKGTLAESIK